MTKCNLLTGILIRYFPLVMPVGFVSVDSPKLVTLLLVSHESGASLFFQISTQQPFLEGSTVPLMISMGIKEVDHLV